MGLGSIFKKVSAIATPLFAGSNIGSYLTAANAISGGLANDNPSTDAYMNQFREGNQYNAVEAQKSRAFSAEQSQLSRNFAASQSATNNALATTFAKQGIRWKAADAKAAGIHPLHALGGGSSFSPGGVSVGGSSSAAASSVSPNIPGQNYSRARRATLSFTDRHTQRLQALQLERAGLENQLLRSEIAKEASAQIGPPMPDTLTETAPTPYYSTVPGHKDVEAGTSADVGWLNVAGGGFAAGYSLDAKTRLEENMPAMLAWGTRHYLAPLLLQSLGTPPPNSYKPAGTEWVFVRHRLAWFPMPANRAGKPLRYRRSKLRQKALPRKWRKLPRR